MASRRETPSERLAREDALRRMLDLPDRDFMEVYEQVRRRADQLGVSETRTDREVRERMEALTALQTLAAHLKLPPDKAPTIQQYKDERGKLGLELTARQIQYRWGMWRDATNALTGKRTTSGAEHQAVSRRAVGPVKLPKRTELPLIGLRAWLTSTPPPQHEYVLTYRDWSRRANRNRAPADRYPSPGTALGILVVPWEVAVEIARPGSKLDLTTARDEYLQQLKEASGPLGLCNITGVALVLGTTRPDAELQTRTENFPPPVALLSRSRVWRWTDIEAYAADEEKYKPDYSEGALQEQVTDLDELARLLQGQRTLEESKQRIRNAIRHGRSTVPTYAGWCGSESRYWLRETVERWLTENPDLVGASTATVRAARGRRRKPVAKRPGRRV